MAEEVHEKSLRFNMLKKMTIVLVSFFISFIVISLIILCRNTIYKGIKIEEIDVSGLSTVEAKQKIEKHFDKHRTDGNIQFIYGEKEWNIQSREISYSYDYVKASKEAYDFGRKGNFFVRITKVVSLYKNPYIIKLNPVYDTEKLDKITKNLKNEIDKPPQDAQISRQGGGFAIKDEQIGLKLNIEELKILIKKELKNLKYTNEVKVELPVEILSPRITSESLSTIEDLLGSYTTKFNANNKNRTQNIKLAAKAISGTILMPGDVFSFNDVVGPRTKNRGYQDAPVIIKGETIDGLGGGVCQVSSTLYNAVLLSGSKVLERARHSIPSAYVPKGRDATVSYGSIDFKFQNNFMQPIFLESYVYSNLLTINIYGKKTGNKTVKIHSVEDDIIKKSVEIRYDSNLPQGQQRIKQRGRDGYKITTYKIIYENGVEISKEQVSKDYYRPQTQIIVKGTKKQPIKNIPQEPKEPKNKEPRNEEQSYESNEP